MWWKLTGVVALTAALIFSVIPIRTHAVLHDPVNDPPPSWASLGDLLGSMYITTGTAVLIAGILAVAGYVAFKVARGHW
ncbi:hypothetical protein [Sphingopyxis sp.]|uniref:hypothetical protein n=1 Tax=Sphingopyxis sp. TaxID=1908224 RepID=UPI003D09E7F8